MDVTEMVVDVAVVDVEIPFLETVEAAPMWNEWPEYISGKMSTPVDGCKNGFISAEILRQERKII